MASIEEKQITNPAHVIKNITMPNIKILKLPDFSFNLVQQSEYENVDLKIFAISWNKKTEIFDNIKKYNILNSVVLANTENEVKFFKQYIDKIGCPDCDVLFCNNNAFINENIYDIDTTKLENNREYDMIINSRFATYKNVDVAKLCSNVAHIGYLQQGDKYVIPTFGTCLNFDRLTQTYTPFKKANVVSQLNNSLVGGIFSMTEGACMASSEYLLSGLPVISTYSQGGRDIWYNASNSIMCKNEKNDVVKCLNDAKNKLKNGFFDRQKIRDEHIKKSKEHRNRLAQYIEDFFYEKNKDIVLSSTDVITQMLH